ncbi:MAG: DUF523 domain-containing protein [Planctomycetes bacterium]|nr:DUF523 domain-containing protein [Planctomycetota bacterium]
MSHIARLGISACLLGERVRWDGGQKRDEGLLLACAGRVEWVPVCPERELGLGVPREPIHLRAGSAGVRLVGAESGREHGAAMAAFATRRSRELAAADLDGFVLKSRSPSCGLEALPVYDERGARVLSEDGVGRFAEILRRELPEIVCAEERHLQAPDRREAFLARAAALRRGKRFFAASWSIVELREFLRAEGPLLDAFDPRAGAELEELLAAADGSDALARSIRARFARALTLGDPTAPPR